MTILLIKEGLKSIAVVKSNYGRKYPKIHFHIVKYLSLGVILLCFGRIYYFVKP